MCDIRIERLKLNQIYIEISAELAQAPDVLFDEVVARFNLLLQSRYQDFCSDACIDAKAREFAELYCRRSEPHDASPERDVAPIVRAA